MEYNLDQAALQCFLDNQSQLFPEGDVASTLEEADEFLGNCLAVVVDSVKEIWEFFLEEGFDVEEIFQEEGIDIENIEEKRILEAAEVFDIGDGRYLIVED